MKVINLVVPDWSICALINGDFDNLSEDDLEHLGTFIKSIKNKYGEGSFQCDVETMNLGFSYRNDVHKLGGNICSVQYLIHNPEKRNPYRDNDFKDLTNEVEAMQKSIIADIERDPLYYAELVADMYFHWKHNTFETAMMVDFHNSVINKK